MTREEAIKVLEQQPCEDDKCQECEKDWTKCTTCPVMMKWVKEHEVTSDES